MPAEFVGPMRSMPMWPAMEGAAHTLAYDGTVVGNSLSGKKLSAERWRSITAPVLVMDGGTAPWLHAGADAIAAALPHAQRLTLQGQSHDVAPHVLAPALIEFFERGQRS
jgi:pimeloyl-ACP methyl ester carboxylesterase